MSVPTSAAHDLWIRRFHQAPDAKVRLLCLPHAGGSASFYFPVSAALSPQIEVLSVQYPGRQDRRLEPSIGTITELADQVHRVLGALDDRPLALFGHSMGAVLGFELARRLEAEGRVPAALFVSGRRGPATHRAEFVHQRDDDGLVGELKTLSGTNTALLGDEEILRMILPAIRNDYRAIETYERPPGGPLSCPIVTLIGDDDPKSTVDEAKVWAEETTGDFSLRVFPGGHFYLAAQQRAVLGEITDRLRPYTG
ncbi:alpha/beta fold hydrolase [Kitasatospora sp. NBC_01250]|uniref:thioesterase II family protein n=1 Tax=unclassified Kitasatospora TaxID=2633591 RepID=UPI002E0DA343|nr:MULTISPECIES: alpha/beta fold hydrolase [unclassified Kitasatospora]WSJ65960.1 alpha/beta fold hydrolase [Kitasatospora sp. NBC_01302]